MLQLLKANANFDSTIAPFFRRLVSGSRFQNGSAHHVAHAHVHHIKLRKEESSQDDLKTKAMLNKASAETKKHSRSASKRHKVEDQNIDLHKFLKQT